VPFYVTTILPRPVKSHPEQDAHDQGHHGRQDAPPEPDPTLEQEQNLALPEDGTGGSQEGALRMLAELLARGHGHAGKTSVVRVTFVFAEYTTFMNRHGFAGIRM